MSPAAVQEAVGRPVWATATSQTVAPGTHEQDRAHRHGRPRYPLLPPARSPRGHCPPPRRPAVHGLWWVVSPPPPPKHQRHVKFTEWAELGTFVPMPSTSTPWDTSCRPLLIFPGTKCQTRST